MFECQDKQAPHRDSKSMAHVQKQKRSCQALNSSASHGAQTMGVQIGLADYDLAQSSREASARKFGRVRCVLTDDHVLDCCTRSLVYI